MLISKLTLKRKAKQEGFTLVELMITIAILAILASVAIPAYNRYVVRTHRDEAIQQLQNIRLLLEECRSTNTAKDYNCLPSSVYDSTTKTVKIGGKYYDFKLEYPVDGGGATNFMAYNLTATPKTGTTQAGDDHCKTFGIDHTSKTTATHSDCWK